MEFWAQGKWSLLTFHTLIFEKILSEDDFGYTVL